jgi:hypothetical protein
MGFYRRRVLPFLLDEVMDTEELRARVAANRSRDFYLGGAPRCSGFCTVGVAARG